jgi:hypothetical protein
MFFFWQIIAKFPHLNKAGHTNKGKNKEKIGKFTKNPTLHDELQRVAFFLFFFSSLTSIS